MAAFSPAKPKAIYQLTFGGSWPMAVTFLGSGNKLAAANQLGQIYVWDLPDKAPAGAKPGGKDRTAPNLDPVRRFDGHTNEISKLAVTPDGKSLLSASYDHSVRVWPVDGPVAGKVEAVMDGETRKRVTSKTAEKVPAVDGIKIDSQTACDVLAGHSEWVHALAISGDGKRAITGDAACKSIVWDLVTLKPISTWTGQPWNWTLAAALSADGKTALVSDLSYKRDDFDIPPPSLKLFDADTGKEKLDLFKVLVPGFKPTERTYGSAQAWRKFVCAGLISVAISPDGKLLALAQGGETDTGKVHLVDAATGKLLRDVSAHRYGVTDVIFTADSQYVISTGRDTCARICQVSDGKEVAVLNTPRGGQFKDWLSAVALSPDKRRLAATDIAGIVHIWEFGA